MSIDFRNDGLPVDDALRVGIAGREDLPQDALIALVPDTLTEVRAAVSRNRRCSSAVLTRLARDSEATVRHLVAGNPSCPPGVLAVLSRDSSFHRRCFVAENPSCPPEVLVKLAEDSEYSVRPSVSSNPFCPSDVLTRLVPDSDFFGAALSRAILPAHPVSSLSSPMTRRTPCASRLRETPPVRATFLLGSLLIQMDW